MSIEPIFQSLLILMAVIWMVAVTLRKFGIPSIMGELAGGVIVGPAVLGWVQPNEIISVLAEMGIFFLMLHAGVETNAKEFFAALKRSYGVAVVGALVPFTVSFSIATLFGLATEQAVFVGLVMTGTAVVITIKILEDIGLQNARFARIIIASCMNDVLLTLVLFSMILGMLNGEAINMTEMATTLGKIIIFFGVTLVVGYFLYPLLRHPFRHREGKGFTFILVLGLGMGLFAEFIGLHMIFGAYMAGLFFDVEVADEKLIQMVRGRLYGIAYEFLGPIFFISLGFHITFDIFKGPEIWFMLALSIAVIIGQILSAGGMARRLALSWPEALSVGVGMCGRAEMSFILASLGLSMGLLDDKIFSVLIFAAFLLNMFTSVGLKGCAILLKKKNISV